MEAQILEVQELELRTAIFFSDRIQAPIGRLIHFSNLQKWGAKLVMPGLAAFAKATAASHRKSPSKPCRRLPGIRVLASSKQEGRGWPGRARPQRKKNHTTAELESAMTVYVIAQLKIADRAAYDRYQARFFDVFRKFNGRLLSADERPSVVEGDWNRDKLC